MILIKHIIKKTLIKEHIHQISNQFMLVIINLLKILLVKNYKEECLMLIMIHCVKRQLMS